MFDKFRIENIFLFFKVETISVIFWKEIQCFLRISFFLCVPSNDWKYENK